MHSTISRLTGTMVIAALLAACNGGSDAGQNAPVRLPSLLAATAASERPADAATDYRAQSLYQGPGPRPGPAMLYADPPRAPQLENTGIWQARPILVSGTAAYRRGEYLYQDYLYDDRGAQLVPELSDPHQKKELFARAAGTITYPSDPVYAGNAADIVELRIRLHAASTAFRLTVNSLIDADKLAFSIALGDSSDSKPFPFGANVKAPAQYFVTVHGSQAVLTDAQTGAVILPAPAVTVDLARRQIQVEVATSAWNPGRAVQRISAGAGLWDAARGRYLTPALASSGSRPGGAGLALAPAAFFNVAFRFNESSDSVLGAALDNGVWREREQAVALAQGDIRPFYANVDFAKLADQIDDELTGQPQGVPQSGTINRIFASQVETKQGVDFSVVCGTQASCAGEYRGQLQPYSLYLPVKPAPAGGYGLSLLLHSLAANHNQYAGTSNQVLLGERGQGHLVASNLARGPDGWFIEDSEADVFEMWADIARHYRLNANLTTVSGYSMGGYGTFMFATRYPDLFGAAHASAAGPTFGYWFPPADPISGDATNMANMLPSLRHVPLMVWTQQLDEGLSSFGAHAAQQRLESLGYRHRVDTFPAAEHLTLYLHDNYQDSADFLGDAAAQRNPARVTFVANPTMDFASRQLIADKAYWVSGIRVRDLASTPRGTVDAVSRAFGAADAVASAPQTRLGILLGKLVAQPYISQFLTWADPGSAPAADRLDISLRNVAALKIDMQRARLSCNAVLAVDTDGPVSIELDGCGRSVQY
jgi:pimeloyl-ACP methyl ester carboxylesterase